MATQNLIKMRIQFRRDTAANWEVVKDTITPAAGEPCFETDTGIFKIGDGVRTYGELEEIGGAKLSADGKSIVLEEGVFKLAGFDAAEVGAQLRKKSDGTIEWVVPSTETVDGLKTTVAGLQSDIKTIQEIVTPSGEGKEPLLNRVNTLEGQVGILNGDATTEGSILKIVKDEINDFATKVSEDETINTIKELFDYVSKHGKETTSIISDIDDLKALVGTNKVSDQIAAAIVGSGHITENKANAIFKKVKYEVVSKPAGTLVDYRDKEIRVMVPADTQWVKQTVGGTGNANMYYMGFRAYAPEGAVGFKEGDKGVIIDEYFDFNGDFAGTDEFGRNYSICWLALASYDEAKDTWTYFGKNSTKQKYLGFDYVVEWYDENGVVIESDHIRINLSNESCHNTVEPFYMANVVKSVSVNGTVLEIVDGKVDIPVTSVVKSSDEIEVAEDGTINIKSISFDKITQAETGDIVFDGGSAAG